MTPYLFAQSDCVKPSYAIADAFPKRYVGNSQGSAPSGFLMFAQLQQSQSLLPLNAEMRQKLLNRVPCFSCLHMPRMQRTSTRGRRLSDVKRPPECVIKQLRNHRGYLTQAHDDVEGGTSVGVLFLNPCVVSDGEKPIRIHTTGEVGQELSLHVHMIAERSHVA